VREFTGIRYFANTRNIICALNNPLGPVPLGVVPINFDLTMKTLNTIEMATRAQERRQDCQNPGLFGEFSAELGHAEPLKLAFTADRYAYVGSPLALTLWCTDGQSMPLWEPYTDLTKNHRSFWLEPTEIVVKTYSENESVRQPLLDTGYFKDTGKRIHAGFVELEVWCITEKFAEAFDAVHGVEAAY
jgi:hypothetical protein